MQPLHRSRHQVHRNSPEAGHTHLPAFQGHICMQWFKRRSLSLLKCSRRSSGIFTAILFYHSPSKPGSQSLMPHIHGNYCTTSPSRWHLCAIEWQHMCVELGCNLQEEDCEKLGSHVPFSSLTYPPLKLPNNNNKLSWINNSYIDFVHRKSTSVQDFWT